MVALLAILALLGGVVLFVCGVVCIFRRNFARLDSNRLGRDPLSSGGVQLPRTTTTTTNRGLTQVRLQRMPALA